MNREEKIEKKKLRAQKRAARNKERNKISDWYDCDLPIRARRQMQKKGYAESWPDSDSPTGYSQVCSYGAYGTCQSPCNGDC